MKAWRLNPILGEDLGDGYSLQVERVHREGTGAIRLQYELWNGAPQLVRMATPSDRKDFDHLVADVLTIAPVDAGRVRTVAAKLAVDASGAEPGSGDIGDGSDAGDAESQASSLVRLASEWVLFRDTAGDPYVTFAGTKRERQTHRLHTKAVRQRLQYLYYTEKGQAPRAQAVQDALGVLAGRAVFEGPAHTVHVRLASHEEHIYLDLGDDAWRAVDITAEGWRVIPSDQVPVKFRRSKGLLPLPCPLPGGTVEEARRFLNITDEATWVLIVAWLVGAFRPRGPYPILNAHGEQGSAKSTMLRVLRALIDPSTVPLRTEPREERDLLIAATNSWVVALDNLSTLPPWFSDAMCRIATGGGFSTRELYSDADETLIDVQRPAMTDGIEEYGARPDYLDRSLIVMLPAIPDERRQPEQAFWQDFEEARPRILGALLTAVSTALRNESDVHLERLPRMADFALWVTAAEPGLGWEPGAFMRTYTANRAEANDLALEVSPVAGPVRAFAEAETTWEGTPSELLQKLNEKADETTRKQRGWPSKPHALTGALRRLAPNLRTAGLRVEFRRTNRQRLITLTWTPPTPRGEQEGTTASPASPRTT